MLRRPEAGTSPDAGSWADRGSRRYGRADIAGSTGEEARPTDGAGRRGPRSGNGRAAPARSPNRLVSAREMLAGRRADPEAMAVSRSRYHHDVNFPPTRDFARREHVGSSAAPDPLPTFRGHAALASSCAHRLRNRCPRLHDDHVRPRAPTPQLRLVVRSRLCSVRELWLSLADVAFRRRRVPLVPDRRAALPGSTPGGADTHVRLDERSGSAPSRRRPGWNGTSTYRRLSTFDDGAPSRDDGHATVPRG